MLKKVRVHIESERRESTVSLFSPAEGGYIPPEGDVPAEEVERTELFVEGRYRDDGDRVSLTYDESAAGGMEGVSSTLSFTKNEPSLVTLVREGNVRTALIFEEGRRHVSVYTTPIMPFEVSIFTRTLQNELLSAGRLTISYTVELRGARAEETKLTLSLLPFFKSPTGANFTKK